jgi:alpha-beta hydrolase superfamily lysophospholipase
MSRNRLLATLTIVVLLSFLPACKERQTTTLDIMTFENKLDHPAVLEVLFHPRKSNKTDPPPGADNIDMEVDNGIQLGCRIHTADPEGPVILFFHGNGEIAADYDTIGPMYTERGINFLVTDYRGYGWSDGTPTGTALLADGRILFERTKTWMTDHGYTGDIFVMGRSLGSGCAIDVAAHYGKEIKGLIIESGFAETLPLARTLGLDVEPLGLTEEDGFRNQEKIGAITIPTFLLHGQRDSLIPLHHAHKLHGESGARNKELQIVPEADHNSLIAIGGHYYFDAIKTFVDKVSGASDWRRRRKQFKETK